MVKVFSFLGLFLWDLFLCLCVDVVKRGGGCGVTLKEGLKRGV